jgi:S1-C subfamily serine protease
MRALTSFAAVCAVALLPTLGEASPEIAEKLQKATVMVKAKGGQGSGVVYGKYIWTAAHVVEDEEVVKVYHISGVSTPAKVLAVDHTLDLAILEIPDEAKFGSTSWYKGTPKVAQEVYCCGCPLGDGWTVSRGIVSFVGRKLEGREFDQMDAPAWFGSSGCGVFDKKTGHCMGIVVSGRHHSHVFLVPVRIMRMWAETIGYKDALP